MCVYPEQFLQFDKQQNQVKAIGSILTCVASFSSVGALAVALFVVADSVVDTFWTARVPALEGCFDACLGHCLLFLS